MSVIMEQKQTIEDLFNNEELKKYMSAAPIDNNEHEASIEKKLERQQSAIDVLSSKDETFWSFK